MANTLYNVAREKFLTGDMSWRDHAFKVCLVHTGTGAYTFAATHTSKSDLGTSVNSGTGSDQLLQNKTYALGAAGASNVTFTTVSATSGNPTIEAIVIYRDNTSDGTTTLVAFIDTATGLPITPNGGDIIVTWDTGTNKIFRL